MSYYPILVDPEGKKVVVVGGGTVAQRKIETLLEHGAVVHVIAQALNPALRRHAPKLIWGSIILAYSAILLIGIRNAPEGSLADSYLALASSDRG